MKLLLIISLMFLFGCATVNMNRGNEFNDTNRTQLIKSQTTSAQVLTLFGEPMSKSYTADGETWKYFYQKIISKAQSFMVTTAKVDTEIKSLDIVFVNGIVTDYTYTFQPFKELHDK